MLSWFKPKKTPIKLTPFMRTLLAMHDYEQEEREGRLPEPVDYVPPACAACGNTNNLTGQEDPNIYDGVCIWHCPCGARTNRFTGKQLDKGEYPSRY